MPLFGVENGHFDLITVVLVTLLVCISTHLPMPINSKASVDV